MYLTNKMKIKAHNVRKNKPKKVASRCVLIPFVCIVYKLSYHTSTISMLTIEKMRRGREAMAGSGLGSCTKTL